MEYFTEKNLIDKFILDHIPYYVRDKFSSNTNEAFAIAILAPAVITFIENLPEVDSRSIVDIVFNEKHLYNDITGIFNLTTITGLWVICIDEYYAEYIKKLIEIFINEIHQDIIHLNKCLELSDG